MNALCGSNIYAEDQLFATLDTTIRKLDQKIILIDTVGFIRKLPHSLVNAFKSTLEESLNADLILQVVDFSDPGAENQIEVTDHILEELGAGHKPKFLVFNKSDLSPASEELAVYLRAKKIPVFYTSAKNGNGLAELKAACVTFFNSNNN